jgi:hypothetical protein
MTAVLTSLVSSHLPPGFLSSSSPTPPRANSKARARRRPRMTPPSGTPAPERRLAVLLAHLRPLATAERLGTAAAAAEAGAGFSASPCAAGDTAEGAGNPSGGGRCVFCNIVAGALPAFKVRSRSRARPPDDACSHCSRPRAFAALVLVPVSVFHSLVTRVG